MFRNIQVTKYLNTIFSQFSDELKEWESVIQKEFPDYGYNSNFLAENQVDMCEELPVMLVKLRENYAKELRGKKALSIDHGLADFHPELIEEFTHFYKGDSSVVLKNYLPFHYDVVGYMTKDAETVRLEEVIPVEAYASGPVVKKIGFKHKEIVEVMIRMKEDKSLHKVSVIPWSAPVKAAVNNLVSTWPDWVNEQGDILRIESGNYVLNDRFVIPNTKKLVIDKGVEIDFIKGAFLWSESAIQLIGSEEEPVVIKSSDGSAKGFTVLQADELSKMSNVTFDGFGTFELGDWILTGAVNFYEADVSIDRCNFLNNHCEDALNIVRSDFNVTNCYFEGIYSDAFDSDFCTGKVTATDFKTIGNDAIDFSGSIVYIANCNISEVNDKGISGGEQSELKIDKCKITGCNIGIASKDKSFLKIEDVTIENCKYGFVSYVKKKEYGPGEIDVVKYQGRDVDFDHLIEKKSKLILNGNMIEGTASKLAEKFY